MLLLSLAFSYCLVYRFMFVSTINLPNHLNKEISSSFMRYDGNDNFQIIRQGPHNSYIHNNSLFILVPGTGDQCIWVSYIKRNYRIGLVTDAHQFVWIAGAFVYILVQKQI